MTKLCFGGSFNPLHLGHLIISRAVAEAKGFEKVVLIPSAQPPHKPAAADLAAPDHRLALCQQVAQNDPFFEVEDIEILRSGPSFTIDTARQLKAKGYTTVNWMIGADMLQILPTWHQANQLIHEVNFIIVRRPGYEIDWSALPEPFRFLQSSTLVAPLVEISATLIRERIAKNLPIRYLVPPEVEHYIHANALYTPTK